jgi:hypothetical protein
LQNSIEYSSACASGSTPFDIPDIFADLYRALFFLSGAAASGGKLVIIPGLHPVQKQC